MSIRYSFIIPHYNTPGLLSRCLRSIPQRDDVQVIVVDDCSPDFASVEQCCSQSGHARLELHQTQQGGSAGRARNVGLGHAVGQWVLFADADDYYVEGFLDVLDHALCQGNTGTEAEGACQPDILYFDVAGNGQRAVCHQQIFGHYLSDHDETEVRYHIWAPWNKVFSRQFIEREGLRFEEVPVGNDAMFCLEASSRARRYQIVEDRLYCLTDNDQSLTFRRPTYEREMDYCRVRIRITRFMEARGLELRYGYHVFSLSRCRCFARQYGWGKALRFALYVSTHYGLWRALRYNRRRQAFEAANPQLIYCD